MAELHLGDLQRWMQTVVVHPQPLRSAVRSREARAILPETGLAILPSRTLTPEERVEIYHGMYRIRMVEALEADFAGLQHFLGPKAFRRLVLAYVRSFPSRDFSLNRLSDHVPDYLLKAPGLKNREFCHDLARLELSVAQVFDEAETPPLTTETIASFPDDAWEHARLIPVTAFRLLSFKYPVNLYLQSVRDEDHDHPRPRPKDTFCAVYRRSFSVYRLDLSRAAHLLLQELVSGRTLGEAVLSATKKRSATREEQLFRWFREWVSGGIFTRVEGAPQAG